MGDRPSLSRTPGRKGSIRMSALEIRERRTARDAGDLRSRLMEVLCRVRESEVSGGRVSGELECACGCGRSMRRTEAP